MAVISLKLNHNEEKMVNFLSDYYEQDKTALIKYSLKELYEDIIDQQAVKEYEAREKSGGIPFVDSHAIMNTLESHRNGA